MVFIVIGAIAAFLVMWSISVRRRLTVMNENIDNAMNQIGVQLSACFDAVTVLLDLTKRYAAHEAQTMNEALKFRRRAITATSTPEDVLEQEGIISQILSDVSSVAELHPELKANEKYAGWMSAVDSYKKMVCTSSLIYNDSVMKLNRELRVFPMSLLAGAFGFHRRDYLEVVTENRRARPQLEVPVFFRHF